MNKRLEEIILEIVLEDYESGHTTASDKESFNHILKADFNIEAGDEAFDFYAECRNMGPGGFYLMYKDELDFSPEFKAEYGPEEDIEDFEDDSIETFGGFKLYDKVHVKTFDFNGQIINLIKVPSGRVIAEVRRDRKDGFFDPYRFYLDELELLTESINEAIEDNSPFKVQEIDREGNKLDQFINFATADEAIAFAKTLKTPAEVIDNTLSESLKEEKVIWTNLDTLEEALSRDDMIADLKAIGKNYNFNKYTDAQIYRIHQREMNKKVVEPTPALADIDNEEDVEYIETSNCPRCNHQLTDAGQCPVCDLGDEEERSSHLLHLDENLFDRRVDPEVFEFKVGDRVAERWNDGEFNVGTITDIKEEEGTQYLVKWDYSDGPDYEWLYGDALTQWIEESLNEEVLNEGPFDIFKKKTLAQNMNKTAAKETKANNKLLNKLGKILNQGLNRTSEFLVDGKWVDFNEFNKLADPRGMSAFIATGTDLADADLNDDQKRKLFNLINAVVKDKDGFIVRKGAQVLKPGELIYFKNRPDLLKIEKGYSAEELLGIEAPANASSDADFDKAPTNEPETTNSANEESTEISTSQESENTTEIETPNWVTDKSIKAAITLLAKRKNGSAEYFDKDGNRIDYRKINTENIDNVFVDKNGEKAFIEVMEEVKNGLAKRKAAAIRSAAIFGEALDDDMEYDTLEEKVITHDSLHDGDMEELLNLAKELGIHTVGELNQFAEREVPQGTSLLDTMRKYRDDLGDDFELKENLDISPETLVECINEEDVDISWFN